MINGWYFYSYKLKHFKFVSFINSEDLLVNMKGDTGRAK
jgi:hypothetical protein